MLEERIKALLEEYLDAPEAWSDNVMIEVNPASREARLVDDEDIDVESSPNDYWDVMDLLSMSVDEPGVWEEDGEAIAEMLSNYP